MNRLATLFVLCLASVGTTALAEGERWEAGASVGTNGLGLELSYRWNDFLRVRTGYHFYDVSFDADADDNNGTPGDELKHTGDLELSNLGLLADWYPWAGVFRVTGGVVVNENNFKIDTACENPSGCEVGNSSFSRTELGTITTKIDIEQLGPYLGIGWDRALDATKRWTVSFEIGAFYQGSPKVEMTSNGSCVNSLLIGAACRAALEEEENEIEKELEDFVLYPVVSLGVGYRF